MIALTVIIRFIHFGALTLLLGAFGFLLLVARPAFKKAGSETQIAFERMDGILLRVAGWSLLIAFASALMWFGIQAVLVTGYPLGRAIGSDTAIPLLTKTQFGKVWVLRLILIALLGGFLLLKDRERDEADWMALRSEGGLLGIGLMVTVALTGHAAATEGKLHLLHLTADSIHLGAAAVWLGGLPLLFLLLTWARRSLNPSWANVAREATRRFSCLALISVGALILTGVVNSWILVGDLPHLVGTLYGRLLLGKLALFLVVLGIAAANLFRHRPGLLAVSAPDTGETLQQTLRRLRRNVLAEACLGAIILVIVGAMGTTAPAWHTQPTWPFAFRLTWEARRNVPGVPQALIRGTIGVILGGALLGYGFVRRRHRAWAIGLGLLAIAFFSTISLRVLAVDAYPTTYLRPTVPYSALSIAKGARLYQGHCAVCHGVNGYGDGPAAVGLARKPADLTARHTAEHTAGDMFWWLTHGIAGSPMPPFGDALSVEDRWDLINFIRGLSSAEQARGMSSLVEPTPWLVAPDFTFGIGVGSGETLKENRGKTMVHLVLFTLPGSMSRLEQLDRAWWDLGLAGARVLAVPMREADRVYRLLGTRAANFPIAVDGNDEILDTYTLFRRTLASEGVPPIPSHMEFLIDLQGYIRARWIPGESVGWSEIPRLMGEVKWLAKEVPRSPAPDEHVH